MANLKEIRNRIGSVNSTMQITSAMKMVSAAKLKRAQDAIVQMRPYAQKLQEILSNLSSSLDSSEGVYSEEREVKNLLIVPITSNRGLCGGFNNNVIKIALRIASENSDKNITMLPIGKKAMDAIAKTKYLNAEYPNDLADLYGDLTFSNVAKVAELIMSEFAEKKVDKVVLVYNAFKNAASQILKEEQMLPILPPEQEEGDKASTVNDYIFEPNKEDIVAELIPKSLKTQLFKAMLDSHASEHGARMTAMHKATDNAGEMLQELKLYYNRSRQAAITGEILEIVGGAEALNG